jgi:type I restriction enzyme R subunit
MELERIRRRDLPHWDVPGAAYFVTACLEGSIPAQGLLELGGYRAELRARPRPAKMKAREWDARRWKLAFVRVEEWLDGCPANRLLEREDLAEEVEKSMYHFAGECYDLLAYVVMPSHFHWVFQPRPEWAESLREDGPTARETVMYSLKRFTGNKCNRVLRRRGAFWQAESYDHWIRDSDEMERIIAYIEENPVKAGLVARPEDWRFSSAWARRLTGTPWGLPLPRRVSGSES